METDIDVRVAALERSSRHLRAFLLPAFLVLPALAALAIAGFAGPRVGASLTADSLRVRELVILDSLGTVRVRLGAHLPDAIIDGKPNFLAATTPTLIERGLHAGNLIREVAKVAGGGGGGRPDMAQAGARDASRLDAALDEARRLAIAALAPT